MAPAVILVAPQLAMNIGTTARAMMNCQLSDLRIVTPKPRWPNELSRRASSGAEIILDQARICASTSEAIADLNRVYATTGRVRRMTKRIVTPRQAAQEAREAFAAGEKVGFLFGPERTGLENDDLALCDALIEVPLNPAFASLNLAQAVLLVGYEWFQAGDASPQSRLASGDSKAASKDELENFFLHLERELDHCGFLRVADKRPTMVRNIRNIFQRAGMTEQEVRTLHGVVAELVRGPRQPS
ncbi:MAG: RNA methyltransferase [Rhodospirillales bacterium]|nr:MAG: RNA methyltransferase [Rhodospirillales bacterium]